MLINNKNHLVCKFVSVEIKGTEHFFSNVIIETTLIIRVSLILMMVILVSVIIITDYGLPVIGSTPAI